MLSDFSYLIDILVFSLFSFMLPMLSFPVSSFLSYFGRELCRDDFFPHPVKFPSWLDSFCWCFLSGNFCTVSSVVYPCLRLLFGLWSLDFAWDFWIICLFWADILVWLSLFVHCDVCFVPDKPVYTASTLPCFLSFLSWWFIVRGSSFYNDLCYFLIVLSFEFILCYTLIL